MDWTNGPGCITHTQIGMHGKAPQPEAFASCYSCWLELLSTYTYNHFFIDSCLTYTKQPTETKQVHTTSVEVVSFFNDYQIVLQQHCPDSLHYN